MVVASGNFPPWTGLFGDPPVPYAYGCYPIFSPPFGPFHIDLFRLAVEWIVITAVGAALYLAWPTRPRKSSASTGKTKEPPDHAVFEAIPDVGPQASPTEDFRATAVNGGGGSSNVATATELGCSQPDAPHVDVHFLQPYGVRGWLLWCAVSLALSSLYFVATVINERDSLAGVTVPGLESIVLAETVAYVVLAAISLTASVLIFVKARMSLLVTQTFLILQLIVPVTLAGLTSSSGELIETTKGVLVGSYVQGATRAAIVSAVWLLYLVRSKRVHNTLRVRPIRIVPSGARKHSVASY